MTSPLVIDLSLAAAFLLREPEGGKLDAILKQVMDGKVEIHVPALFTFELLNILTMAERRKRITNSQKISFLSEWELIPLHEDSSPNPSARRRILTLAHEHHLTAYDAAYLELAERFHAKLVSLDADLLKLKRKYAWIS